jgi:CheY-like chemotaxis protein
MAKRKGQASAGRRKSRSTQRRKKRRDIATVETALASLAHEIRTPLNAIIALSELLAASGLDPRALGWAQGIRSAGEHLARYTTLVCDGVRAGASGLALRQDPFDPRALARAAGASLAARAQTSGLSSEVGIAPDLPAGVTGDEVRLRAALENLIDNAVKFTARGTIRLDVSAEVLPRDRAQIVFSVSDSGIGLTDAEIRKLFRPFAQASASVARHYGGTGLGLALVKRLARAMGGDLAVTSAPGRGSTFSLRVVMPTAGAPGVSDVAGGTVRAGDAVPPPVAARRLKVLCVEDNAYGRVVMQTILAGLGHDAEFAGTGEAAIAAALDGTFDLLLMDVTLPDLDGIEVTRRIRALPGDAARVPIIGISGHSAPEEQKAARIAGMDFYLGKPVAPAALAEAIAKVVK